ncbi:peptidase C15 [Methylobacterium durans]|uniref:pyroglutamyl-peptidase I family protein n=1 Tax=Methylobacterium durans TaxID=2202825 RepID=UPI002AFE6648|nr:peptidase C15 [Methylobacterium durans]MEA1833974.1 peptidase C15 [Methylobacterium durans]
MSGRLLVTGFGPFPGMARNPSAALARRLGAMPALRLALGGSPRVLVLRTAYDAIPEILEPALAEAPAAVLMFGVSGRARRMRIEVRARNRASRLFPDATGRRAARLALDPAGPSERTSPAAPAAVAILRRHGVPVAASRDAGRYLCNASYFRALAEPCPVLFVHIPPGPRTRRPRGARPALDPQRTGRALAAVARMLTRRARRGF